MNATVRIVGLGSYRGADAVGWRAVRALEARGFAARFPPGIVALRCRATPLAAIAELVGSGQDCGSPGSARDPACRLVVFVDAVDAAPASGPVLRLPESDLAPDDGSLSVHGTGLGTALSLVRALDPAFPEVVVFGIGAPRALGAAALTAILGTALPALTEGIAAEVRRFIEVANEGCPVR